ncbi:MAG: alpha/beta fold hydrolase BchO [Burkholderiales bacterium]
MAERLSWQREGRDWPNREASRFVEAGGIRWHVQVMPAVALNRQSSPKTSPGNVRATALEERPVVLLVHGTGAASHSWRGLMGDLAQHFTVVAPDLPGHGFTSAPPSSGYALPAMARALAALLDKLALRPSIAVGHSAGAAILARMCLDGSIAPRHLVSLNGALLPLGGIAGEVFSPLARLLSGSRLVPRLFAWRAEDPKVLDRLLDSTGSNVDPQGKQLYGTLVSNPHHAAAALEMMAQWDLREMPASLSRFAGTGCTLTLVVGENDKTVPPFESERVCKIVPNAKLVRIRGVGHLAHEERPQRVSHLIEELAA